MLLQLAASASASTSKYVEAAVVTAVGGTALVSVGRLQRRTDRHFLSPGSPVRVGDCLIDVAPVRRRHRVVGRVFEILGWFFLFGCAIQTVMSVRSAMR